MFRMHACVLVATIALAGTAFGQAAPPAYGPPISMEQAQKAAAAAIATAKENNWPVAIAIVDSGGQLVHFQKIDNTQHGSIEIALDKAKTAVSLKRPTKVLQDAVAQGGGGLRLLAVRSILPLEGGVPILVDGKLIGGIGVSGVTSEQDAQVAQAGADATK
jgi:uncharacterized protein GlcG (DUF336 family)